MHCATRLLLAAILIASGALDVKADEAVALPSGGESCKSLASDSEFNAWRCPGPAGYSLVYNDSVMHAALSIFVDRGGKNPDRATADWAPAASGIGSRIEWRMANGKPFAAIIARWRRVEEDATIGAAIEELLIVKVAPDGGCGVATVGALTHDAMAAAREIAERRVPVFRCGTDEMALDANASSSAVKRLDGRFGAHETLEHNGSLVGLTRSPSGDVEIRYFQPRAALKVERGTLLFRGHEKGGQLSGSAFLFRQGCAPAEYNVSGRRTDGLLVLEGIAPRRGSSCALTASASSKPSQLVFTHEPLIEVSSASQEREVMAQCSQCVSATLKAVEGLGTDHARVTAEITNEDVRDYCENWNTEASRVAACLHDHSGDLGKVQEASANCKELTVRPSSGGQYKFNKIGADYGGVAPVWTDLATGKAECGARSCNSATATAHFAMLCPQAISGWTGRRY